jgi:hypothetical protein
MITPGKIYAGSTIRITIAFQDDDGNATDPDTVLFKTRSPAGTETTYTYGDDDEVGRSAAGSYYADFEADEGGRWLYRWQGTSDDSSPFGFESSVVVQKSDFDGFTGSWGTDYE